MRLLKHVMLPLLPSGVVFGLYLTPASAIGCLTRGLLALAVVLISLLTGIVLAVWAILARRAAGSRSAWLALSAAILTIPGILILGPLG